MTTVSKWFAEFFGIGLKGAKAEAAKIEEAVKTEVANIKKSVKCGCGRSPTGLCLGLHKLTEEQWAVHKVNPNRVVAAVTDVVKKSKTKVVKEVDDELKEIEQKIETAIKKSSSKIKKKNGGK